MENFFGVWVALAMCGSALAMVLLHYAFVEGRRKEGSSFFSWEFARALLLPELILFGFCFVLGFGLGQGMVTEIENLPLKAFLCLVALLIVVALVLLHYSIIVKVHAQASRSRRLQGKRAVRAVRA